MASGPFAGLESTDPFSRLRVGRITAIRDTVAGLSGEDAFERFLGTAEIEWIDWGGVAQAQVPLGYPSFSNPVIFPKGQLIQETVSSALTGSSYGFMHMPSVGDLVVCGFRYDGRPVILNYLAHNYYQQTQSTPKAGSGFGIFRRIVSGEYSWKSKQQAEVYLDRKGAMRLLTKAQPASDATRPSTDLASLTLGVVYDTTTFTNPEVDSLGKQVVARLRSKLASGGTGGDVTINEDGTILISGAGGSVVQVNANGEISITPGSSQKVKINNGTKGAARLDDATVSNTTLDSTFWTFMSTLVTSFNTHMHPTAGVGAPSLPTILLGSAPTTLAGKINAASTKVLIGD